MSDKMFLRNSYLGHGEMVQLAKCLLHKHNDLNLDPQGIKVGCAGMSAFSGVELCVETGRLQGLIGTPASPASETQSQYVALTQNKVGVTEETSGVNPWLHVHRHKHVHSPALSHTRKCVHRIQ